MKDFVRFALVLLVILFGLSLIWFALYIYGSSRHPSTYQTELAKSLVSQGPITIEQRIPFELKKATSPFMAIEIFNDKDQWLLKSAPKNIPFSTFLGKHPKPVLFVKLRLNRTSNAASLKKIVDIENHWKRIVFTSDSDGTLHDLRELDPRWTFSSGGVFLTRFMSLSSLGLESLIEIPGDVFLVNPKVFPPYSLSPLIDEAMKQNKLVILGPVSSIEERKGIHGWVLVKD